MRTYRNLSLSVSLSMAALLTSCASVGVLPENSNKSQMPWASYADALTAYEAVKVNASTLDDIQTLGFDAAKVPNIKILNYVDVVNLFGPAFKMEDMPDGIKTCVAAKEKCTAYAVRATQVKNKRDGNIAADLLGFQKHTSTVGWEFNATLILVADKVVYKLWNGTPDIKASSREFNPLGPMQNMSGLIPKPF